MYYVLHSGFAELCSSNPELGKGIDYFVLCNKHINYAKYIKQCIAKKVHF